jgi:hypothetical protein
VAVLSGAAGPGGGAVASRCQARVSSLRAIAMVAILFPRRLAMAAQAAENSGDRLAVWAAWFMTCRSQAGPCPGDVAVPHGQAPGRGPPG